MKLLLDFISWCGVQGCGEGIDTLSDDPYCYKSVDFPSILLGDYILRS